MRFVPLSLFLALALLDSGPSTHADGTVVTYMASNTTAMPRGGLNVRFSGVGLHDLVLVANPALCPPPVLSFIDSSSPWNHVAFEWSCDCVQPGDSVTFTVHSGSGAVPVEDEWSSLGACPGAVATTFRVLDLNGDVDGYPDTNESVDLTLGVSNKWNRDLTNVIVRISTDDPRIDCIVTPVVFVGDIPSGGDAELPGPFRLHVHPSADRGGAAVVCSNPGPGGTCSNFVSVPGGCASDADCRRSALDEYRAEVAVIISADQFPFQSRSQVISLDMDLDSAHSSGSTSTFVVGFEAGFGGFTFQNLDADKASNSASDGYRCQYNDPDFVNSNSYGKTECYLGFQAGQNPVNDWHIHSSVQPDGGRAFQGVRSLHYGKHTAGDPGLDTYGLSQMDALRTKSAIHLAARVCRDDPAADKRACGSAADCTVVGSGPCVSSNPELSFKQQISLFDHRVYLPPNQAADRGVVHARLAGSATWQKLYPFENIYDTVGENYSSECKFDPIDDGNNEDSYFDPTDPNRRYGPSSTCFPEFSFSGLGDTDEPFDPGNVASATDGPGLPGSLGIGTWVESRFDLSRYRGRSIELRFLLTSIKLGDTSDWEHAAIGNPVPWDDGWYIDDVHVTQTLGTTSPTVTVDGADNSALQPGNADGDARGDECDCAPANPGAFAVPADVDDLRFAADKVGLVWASAAPSAGDDTVHDVVRGVLDQLPVGAGADETCLAPGIPGSTVSDSSTPEQRAGFWYVVRGRNPCGPGTYGIGSGGAPRVTAACP